MLIFKYLFIHNSETMKIKLFFLLGMFVSFVSFAQDTIRVETVRVDTVKIETVRIDTVLNQPVSTKPPANTVQAPIQQQKPILNPNKMYFGGYVNANFGKYTAIGIEPLVGYKLTPKLSFGAKISYEYISDKRYEVDYNSSNYGISVFNRIRLSQRLYTHAEFSEMNYKLYDSLGESNRTWVPFLFLGGGLSQPISKNTWFTAEVLFDVIQNENSPYKNWEPFLSLGFGVGF
jgi:hypothetical protein